MKRTDIIHCPCSLDILVYTETQPEPRSVYGFKVVSTIMGHAKLDHFDSVVCTCGRKHSLRRITNTFTKQAIKAQATAIQQPALI